MTSASLRARYAAVVTGLAAATCLSVAACSDQPVAAPSATPPAARLAIAPPSGQIASGVAIDGAPLGKPGMTAWDKWSANVGKRAQYIMWFADWSSSFQSFAVTNAYDRGATPVITWEMKNRNASISYADVLGGKWNKYIDTWAAAARADGRPLFLRFGHEMNGNWYGWSGAKNGASISAPAQFIAMWRYVHDRFVRAGATNVTWVWCANHESVPAESWNTPEAYWPGSAYVDWTCADGYNWGTSQTLANAGWVSQWQSFDAIFASVYARVTALDPSKPFMIGEFASSEAGGNKSLWIANAASRITSTDYALLRGFIWFNYNKETDWRVESSATSLDSFKANFAGNGLIAWK